MSEVSPLIPSEANISITPSEDKSSDDTVNGIRVTARSLDSKQEQSSNSFQHGSESVVYYGSISKVPFDGTNYSDWKYQMECELISHDLLRYIHGDPIPLDEESSSQRRGRLKTFSAIAKAMDLSQRHLVSSVTMGDSWAAWNSIANYYQRNSRANRRKLKREFNTLKIQDFESFGDFKTELNRLSALLASMGDTMDDETLLTALLDGVCENKELEPMVNIIDATSSICYDEACRNIESFLHKKQTRGLTGNRRQSEQLNNLQTAKSKRICFKFRDTGRCKFGDKCRYLHKGSSRTSVCRNFQRTGKCKYGDKCKFRHVSKQCEEGAHIHEEYGPASLFFAHDDREPSDQGVQDFVDDPSPEDQDSDSMPELCDSSSSDSDNECE